MTATDNAPSVSSGLSASAPEPGAPGSGGGLAALPMGLLKLARPKQWAKNVLVFAAPGAAGVLDEVGPLRDSIIAFVCFCLAAAGTYYINDARDVEADRLHPKKRFRPIASGIVSPQLAFVAGAALLLSAVGLSFAASDRLALVVGAYIVMTTAYSTWLKHIAVVDLVTVAAGFVLRMVAGAEATGVPISDWAFIVTIFGSLFMVSGKRGAEAAEMGEDASSFRSVLAAYSTTYTAYLRSVSSGAVLVSYCMWVAALDTYGPNELLAETHVPSSGLPWFQASILPFVMAVLRYALVLDQGKGSAPEDIVLGDRILQIIGLCWVVVFGIGVYTA